MVRTNGDAPDGRALLSNDNDIHTPFRFKLPDIITVFLRLGKNTVSHLCGTNEFKLYRDEDEEYVVYTFITLHSWHLAKLKYSARTN